MTNNGSSDQLDLKQVAALLQQSIVASNERMTKLEQSMVKSDERLTRIEQVVESNNRFLEAFGQSVKKFTDTATVLNQRLDGVIASANSDRLETNTRLSRIENKVNQILEGIDQNQRGSQLEGGDDLPV
ncbi:MAG: hypothetical protein JOZ78_17585 [Chroococcidiopsidaceae cyanobacterium CP_BM_ER_R8_30]|nr:hypothetical protein [Chroococcidiopsidaceae cyanobacterium CP_BM_ER_R8_30]